MIHFAAKFWTLSVIANCFCLQTWLHDIGFNDWCRAIVISLPPSAFRFLLDSHSTVPSSPMSFISIFIMYSKCVILPLHFPLNVRLILFVYVLCLPFLFILFSLVWFHSSTNFIVTLMVDFMFGWLLQRQSIISANWPSLSLCSNTLQY
jgi:hypothetical protein